MLDVDSGAKLLEVSPSMKISLLKRLARLRLALVYCVVMEIISVGCKPITKEEVSGVYVCAQNGVVDTIVLNTNGTFDQTVMTTNAGPWTIRGSWTFNSETVSFDSFYESFEIARANGADKVIPPHRVSMGFLWIRQGRLQLDVSETFPIWERQTTNNQDVKIN